MPPVSRRRALQAVSGLVAGLAGCSVLPGESDAVPVPTAWTSDVRQPTPGVRVDGGPLVVGSASPWPDDDLLVGLDPDSGEEQWRLPAGDDRDSGGSSALAHDGTTAFGYTTTGTVRAVDAADGTVEWTAEAGPWEVDERRARLHAPPVVDGVVVVPVTWPSGDAGHRLIGFDAATGDDLWRYEVSAPVAGAPATSDGVTLVPRTDGVLEAVDAAGNRRWRTERPDPLQAVTATGGRAYVGTAGERLEVFDTGSGAFRWAFETENAVLTRPGPGDGAVYAGSADYYVYAVETVTGDELWRSETVNAVTGGPVRVGDTLVSVFGGSDADITRDRRYSYEPEGVCAHDAHTGDLIGEFVYDEYYDEGSPHWVRDIGGEAYVGHERGLVKLDRGALDD